MVSDEVLLRQSACHVSVLILVLMEYDLEQPSSLVRWTLSSVLILVLMEYGLGIKKP